MVDHKIADAAELKEIEKTIRKEVQEALKKAKVRTSCMQECFNCMYRACLCVTGWQDGRNGSAPACR